MVRGLVRAVPVAALVWLSSTSSTAQQPSATRSLVLSEFVPLPGAAALVKAPSGDLWFIGNTCSTGLPTTGQFHPTAQGCDGVLGRIAPDGALHYLSYLTGGGALASALAVDSAGNVFVAGSTLSPNFPTTEGAYDRQCGTDGTCETDYFNARLNRPIHGPLYDGFVMKLTPDGGQLVFATYLGGVKDDQITAIAVDVNGDVHVAGQTWSEDYPVTADAPGQHYDATTYGPDSEPTVDAFYARLSADGRALRYSTYIPGSGNEYVNSIAVAADLSAHVAGSTTSADLLTRAALQPQRRGQSDAWLAKFTPAGLAFSTYVGGDNSEGGGVVTVDTSAIYLATGTCGAGFPGDTRPTAAAVDCSALAISELSLDGSGLRRTAILHGVGGLDTPAAIAVDAAHRVYVAGTTWYTNFYPTTSDAYQRSNRGEGDAFLSIVPMGLDGSGVPEYSTYLGSSDEEKTYALALDGSGGAYLGGYSRVYFGTPPAFPLVNAQTSAQEPAADGYRGFIAHFAHDTPPAPGAGDIVLYARDSQAIAGNWQRVPDASAAGGARMSNGDAGAPKIGTAAASPVSYFDLTFQAEAGVPYHLWLRMQAFNDDWQNDSVFVQFSDSVDGGSPVWRIGSSSATVVSLEDCSGCGEHGWGWNDNGYGKPGLNVVFAASGTHTIRIQQREDGISIDQVVLSRQTYINTAPGANKDDTTILPASDGSTPPAPPPPSDPKEIVLYATDRLRSDTAQNWFGIPDPTAAGTKKLQNPDQGQPKLASASAAGNDYFEMAFTAQAGIPYHLWIRSQAANDSYTNDSVFVQFDGTVNESGTPTFRIGTDAATYVSLEDCSGCGDEGWGWNDNAYGSFATPIYFATSGQQIIRVLRREDGISIDQIVLSAGKYLNSAPGLVKNDTTIVPK